MAISGKIGICKTCLKRVFDEGLVREIHSPFRTSLNLPPEPSSEEGVKCNVCVNECVISLNHHGYCGIRVNHDNAIRSVAGQGKLLAYIYLDPIPTNCVSIEFCPATTGAGYPEYSVSPNGDAGYYNLAVFLYGCNLDCLFCQNIEHKLIFRSYEKIQKSIVNRDEFIRLANRDDVTCICYFGGDPTPHILELLPMSNYIVRASKEKRKVKRICWETNGLMNPALMRAAGRLSLTSGGIVKIDWKAWDAKVYSALTGINGEKALRRLKENTELLAKMSRERPEIPLLTVSTLLVPGYVDEEEVGSIAAFLASLDENIPYVLLAFYPHHLMADMPKTSYTHAQRCYREAKKAGLKKVSLGNIWLLSDYLY